MNEKTVVVGNHEYDWYEFVKSYIDEDWCYGAALDDDGKWVPLYIAADFHLIEWADEWYDNLETAIVRSRSYFINRSIVV